MSIGCGSSGSTGTGGTSGGAGTTGSGNAGTTGSGSAGTTGSGNAGTTGSGNAGTIGTGGGPAGCQMSTAPTGTLISDFSMTDGGALVIPIGGTFSYGTPAPVLAHDAAAGNWRITLNAPGATAAQYLGFGIYMNGNPEGTYCINASTYAGVSFKISGSVAGCTVQYSNTDSQHAEIAVNNPKASGGPGSYAPQKEIPVASITSTATTIMAPFAGTGAPSGGMPMTAIDPIKLTGVQWQFTVAAAATAACVVDIRIDDVTFF